MRITFISFLILFLAGCDKDVTKQVEIEKGITFGKEYRLKNPVFYKVYRDVGSLEIPGAAFMPTIDEFKNGVNPNNLIKRIVDEGKVVFVRAVKKEYSSHYTYVSYGNLLVEGKVIKSDIVLSSLIDYKEKYLSE